MGRLTPRASRVRFPEPAPPPVTNRHARYLEVSHATVSHAWGVPCIVAVTTVADLGDLTRFDTPRQLRHDLGLTPSAYVCQWGAASAGQHDEDRHYPCPSCLGRRRLGLPVSGPRQSAPPTAPGTAPRRALGDQLASPGPALYTVSPAHGHRQKGPPRCRGHCLSMACLSVCHGPACGSETQSRQRAAGCRHSAPRFLRPSAAPPPRCGVTLGSVTRPQGTLVPRRRQAPDGGTEGGSQPTESSVINRRVYWLRLFR